MSVALVTGGLGFIGSFVARRLLAERLVDRVVVLDGFRCATDPTRPEYFDYRGLRLRGLEDRVILERGEPQYGSVAYDVLERYRPRYVFHLASIALSDVENLTLQEAQEGSVVSTSHLLEAIGRLAKVGYRPERVVYASSSMVYGDFVYEPADEVHPTRPATIYGTAKLAGEVVARGLADRYAVPLAIVRPSAVYGPTDMNRRVSQVFVERALRGERLTVRGAGEALDFTYVEDTAHGFVLAATEPAACGETFNVTCGRGRRLIEFVEILKQHCPQLEYEVVERDGSRPRRGGLAIDKARKLLGYEPVYDLERGLAAYVAFVRAHRPELEPAERARTRAHARAATPAPCNAR